ncbi:ABC transporter ATP-binding protein [Chrysiogenes arsenatis]|uniref:ABC transporter ATP-binding protein n=1 Tax=Chrysiogenes arsenatis TaxID=309797 RepID=UPI0003F5B42B|nr:ABC transporter ATP-binding protein [Chrysiogenes arsenatis]
MKHGLTVDNLVIHSGENVLVRGVHFHVPAGKIVALIGESGSGKSLTAKAIMGLLPHTLKATGSMAFNGKPLDTLSTRERTRHMAMVFQEPMTSLNPCFRVGYQITERVALEESLRVKERRQFGITLLGQVGIDNPEWRYDQFPHELSGGMRQRVMIAMALASQPQLIIADEPTTALDVAVQWKVMRLFQQIIEEKNLSLLFITHDIALASQISEVLLVMYAGRIIEAGALDHVVKQPLHPYTKSLLNCLPERMFSDQFVSICGVPPRNLNGLSGCAFAPRCPVAQPRCHVEVPEWSGTVECGYECHFPLRHGDVCR